jgi:hypothetical protein
MRLDRKCVPCLLACVIPLVLVSGLPSAAQDFRGRINGVVADNSGAVLPGVTITAASPALIASQVRRAASDSRSRRNQNFEARSRRSQPYAYSVLISALSSKDIHTHLFARRLQVRA